MCNNNKFTSHWHTSFVHMPTIHLLISFNPFQHPSVISNLSCKERMVSFSEQGNDLYLMRTRKNGVLHQRDLNIQMWAQGDDRVLGRGAGAGRQVGRVGIPVLRGGAGKRVTLYSSLGGKGEVDTGSN